eukprot:TRINITY_DN1855_c0_g1_i2.p1 TRINITY_DN1855_c0_g1~~TRINITY_DN1855_c0_g1_i2.p1  ORF type:complete len:298 (+),score=61.92 TRINITY_DN1855_c0_g1_i2:27-920(+)
MDTRKRSRTVCYQDELVTEEEMKQLEREFKQLNEQKKTQCVVIDEKATQPCNVHKNRYEDVLPYEKTVVRLQPCAGADSDYINANFVRDLTTNVTKKQLYICGQAPLTNTMADWWRMIWEQQVPVIVMITNIMEKRRVKADRYWPVAEGEEEVYGNIHVKFTKERLRAGTNIRVRTFHIWKEKEPKKVPVYTEFKASEESEELSVLSCEEVPTSPKEELLERTESTTVSEYSDESSETSLSSSSKEDKGEVRKVVQLHCTKWPDHGVPKSSVIMKDLIIELDLVKQDWKKPILVHCR